MKTTKEPAQAWAEQLWNRLHESLLDAHNSIIAIIESKAWEPLGYETFSKAWIDKMSDISIASEMRPHVVYQMLGEELTPAEIAAAVKGVGAAIAEDLKRQRDNGVPPDMANRTPHRKPTPYATLFLKVSRKQLKEWRRVARANDASVEDIVLAAAEVQFRRMDKA